MSAFYPAPGFPPADICIFNARLVDRDRDAPGAAIVRGGKIARVLEGSGYADEKSVRALAESSGSLPSPDSCVPAGSAVDGISFLDAKGSVLMPAFVDLHAHFRDPGFTQKEDLESASRAAAAGGYGTVVLMANTNPVISEQSDAEAVNGRAQEIGLVETYQAVSLTRNFDGRDASELSDIDPRMVPVATEDGKEVASAAVMLDAMKRCAETGVVVSCHCEDPELALAAKPFRMAALEALREGRTDDACAKLSEAGRLLRLAEDTMTARNLSLAEAAGCRVHIAHVSTTGSLDAVRQAKARNAAVTCEVTPHHLALTDDRLEIVNPPLRSEADRQSLIGGILDGSVDAIATDHAPHTAEDKAAGSPGFSGIEIAFATCNTALVKTGHVSLKKLSSLMSANPSAILGLRRGLLAPGYDADLVLVDVGAGFTVDPARSGADGGSWHSRGKYTPLAGSRLTGKIVATFKRGRLVYGGL